MMLIARMVARNKSIFKPSKKDRRMREKRSIILPKKDFIVKISIILLFILTICIQDGYSQNSEKTESFELRKVDVIPVSYLWNTSSHHTILRNDDFRLRYAFFGPGFRLDYADEHAPLLLILISRNNVIYEPSAYILYGEKSILVNSRIQSPSISASNNTLFSFELSERGCENCQKAKLHIIEDSDNFIFKIENIIASFK